MASEEIANTEQAAAWDGPTGAHWAAHDETYVRTSLRHTTRLFERAEIAEADRVLDIGCGTGTTTCDAAERAAAGTALGLDLSAAMLEIARARASDRSLGNVSFEQADAQVHQFEPGSFDIAISRFGCMFFADAVAAFSNIAGGLAEGGRVALLSWDEIDANEWIRETRLVLAAGRALPSPPPGAPGMFGLSDPERIETILDAAGFDDVQVERNDDPVMLGPDAEAAAAFIGGTGFAQTLLEDLAEGERKRALLELTEMLREHESANGVELGSSVWLTSAQRRA